MATGIFEGINLMFLRDRSANWLSLAAGWWFQHVSHPIETYQLVWSIGCFFPEVGWNKNLRNRPPRSGDSTCILKFLQRHLSMVFATSCKRWCTARRKALLRRPDVQGATVQQFVTSTAWRNDDGPCAPCQDASDHQDYMFRFGDCNQNLPKCHGGILGFGGPKTPR